MSHFISKAVQDTAKDYNRRRIGTRRRSIEWCHFSDLQWSLTKITKSRYFQRQITRKWRKLQWQTEIKSIDRRHFQWPWTTRNGDFKVTSIFDAEYLCPHPPLNIYGRRYRHIDNDRRTRTRIQSIEWCHFQWPPI